MAARSQPPRSMEADAEDPCRSLVGGQDAEPPSAPSPSPRRGARWALGAAAAAAMLGAVAASAWWRAAGRAGLASSGEAGIVSAAEGSKRPPVKIVWVEDTTKCVGVPGGLANAKSTTHLKLVSCHDALLFTVPTPIEPRIHVSQKPELCVDNPGPVELMLFSCDASGDKANNLLFVLLADGKNRSRGTIQTIKNTSRCMDTPRNEIGAPVQMWECIPDSTHELFMLEFVDLQDDKEAFVESVSK